ncbi:MAG: DUF4932 domain-containing protein [Elusimicrobiota bacterium]|nr:DUF4932 domain-containing protein [Elusimicrobiota bacterium]
MIAALLALAASAAVAAPPAYPEARTDPRFELFGVVQLLADADRRYSGFHRHDIPYTRAAQAWFSPFKRHPAVESYENLAAKGLDHIFFNGLIFSLGDPPALEPREPFEPGNLAQAGGAEALEEFRILLADLARVSRFADFYRETGPYRGAMVEEVSRQAAALDVKGRLEDYAGMKTDRSYTLILSPFAEPSLGSTWARDEPGGRRLTSLYGPEDLHGAVAFRLPTRLGGLWTEILTDMLGPAARPHRVRINRSKKLHLPLGAACAADWYDCFQRHVAFAAGARMLALSGEEEAAAEWPVKYARIGLPHLSPLVERLRDYETDRGRYPTLLDFYPRLLEALEAVSGAVPAPIPFQGGVAAVLSSPGGLTVILPGAEGAGVEATLRRRVKARWKNAALLSDEEALAADLTGRTLIVIGTAKGNRWLARSLGELQLPMRFVGAKLALDARPGDSDGSVFEGKVGLITAAVNPADQSKGLALYTAAEPGLLASLVGAYDGPADFVVLEAGAPVKLGRYEKSRRPWRLK